MEASLIGGRYRPVRRIGSGVYGEVLIGVDVTLNVEIAIKREEIGAKYQQLRYESKVYGLLQGGVDVPRLH
jgi:hypothetical protein